MRGGGRSPLQALASSPTMVGAITTLIVIVAVFLAYNANNGLPFVPTYRVSVEVPNAARMVRNNEVRIGGNRVGVVESIEAIKLNGDSSAQSGGDGDPSDGSQVAARLNLKLDKTVEELPVDSIFRVRYKSSFGLKYLEITRGESTETAQEGFTFVGTDDNDDPNDSDDLILSLEEVEKNQGADNGTFIDQTEFDDIGNTFDQRTRNASRQNLLGYGNAFAGRGASLNLAIESLEPLFRNLKPVTELLVENDTRFRRLFPELADAARIVAPVATQQAELFTNMAITFEAISSDPEALKETISEGPPTLAEGIRTFPAQRTFLAEFADLSDSLRPGVGQLRLALPDLNEAVDVGTPVLKRTPQMNEDLEGVFGALEDLADDPSTGITIERLGTLFDNADPLAEFVAPIQTVCNYWNYWFSMLTEHLTERDGTGYTQRVTLISTPPGSLSVSQPLPGGGEIVIPVPGEVETGLSEAGYSGRQANGRAGQAAPDPPGFFDPREYPILHGNPTGPTGQDGSDCQGGQNGYLLGALPLPGQGAYNPAVGLPDLPGDRGVTDVYFTKEGDRELRDTRVESRQP